MSEKQASRVVVCHLVYQDQEGMTSPYVRVVEDRETRYSTTKPNLNNTGVGGPLFVCCFHCIYRMEYSKTTSFRITQEMLLDVHKSTVQSSSHKYSIK